MSVNLDDFEKVAEDEWLAVYKPDYETVFWIEHTGLNDEADKIMVTEDNAMYEMIEEFVEENPINALPKFAGFQMHERVHQGNGLRVYKDRVGDLWFEFDSCEASEGAVVKFSDDVERWLED